MGKKALYNAKSKKDVTNPVARTLSINLHKRLHKATFKNKAPKAIKQIREQAQRVMFTNDVRVDPEVNKFIWEHGIRNVARRVKLTLERKKNEEDDENVNKMYTLVKLAEL
jgi:large subunit ribosomal protein L31e